MLGMKPSPNLFGPYDGALISLSLGPHGCKVYSWPHISDWLYILDFGWGL